MKNEGKSGRSGVQPLGLGRRFKHAARLLVLAGVALIATGLFAEAASASNTEPVLTATRATFHIPSGNSSNPVWRLSLWALPAQSELGEDTGTSGVLIVRVPAISGCDFQVDVTRSGVWYSGFKADRSRMRRDDLVQLLIELVQLFIELVEFFFQLVQFLFELVQFFQYLDHCDDGQYGHFHQAQDLRRSRWNQARDRRRQGKGTGPATKPATSVPSSKLAFTGTGIAMWIVALFGALLVLTGSVLLRYARRYPRTA